MLRSVIGRMHAIWAKMGGMPAESSGGGPEQPGQIASDSGFSAAGAEQTVRLGVAAAAARAQADEASISVPRWPFTAITGVFVLLLLFTRRSFIADTVCYVFDIFSSSSRNSLDNCRYLWDAGHLLWGDTYASAAGRIHAEEKAAAVRMTLSSRSRPQAISS